MGPSRVAVEAGDAQPAAAGGAPAAGGAARGRAGGAAGRRGDPWRGAAARWLPAAQDAPGRGVCAVDRPGEPGAAGRAGPHARAGAGVHGLSGLERGHADARLRRAGVRRAPVSALLQRQGQPRGDAADPAAARRAAPAPAGVPGRALPGHRVAVSLALAPGRQARRVSHQPEHGQLGDRALRAQGRDPHRRRQARAGRAPAPVPPSPGDEHGQREHPADGDPGRARSRLDRDDRALRPHAR